MPKTMENHRNSIRKEDSRLIEWLRFPLIAAVVLIHSPGGNVDGTAIEWSLLGGNEIFTLFRIYLSKIISHIAVPGFFVISGYLLFSTLGHCDKATYRKKLAGRVRTLLIPYLLWNLIAILSSKVLLEALAGGTGWDAFRSWIHETGGIFGLFWNGNTWGPEAYKWLGGGDLSSAPVYTPFWYLRDLMVATLLSPVTGYLVRNIGFPLLVGLGFCFVFSIWPALHGLSCIAAFFFSVGAYLGSRHLPLTLPKRWGIASVLAALVLSVIALLLSGHSTWFERAACQAYCIAGTAAAFFVGAHLCRKWTWPKVLTQSVFIIYALHGMFPVVRISEIAVSVFPSTNLCASYAAYLVQPCMKIALCLTGYVLLKRICPTVLAILTGGRAERR